MTTDRAKMGKGAAPDADLPHRVIEARKGTRGRLARTVIAQGIGLGGKLLQQVVLVPLFIAAWGVDVYQDWLILFAAATLLSIFDFGLQIYFGNRLTIAWLEGGAASLDRALAIAMGCYAVVLPPLLIAVLVAVFWTGWSGALGIRVLAPGDAGTVFGLLAVTTLATLPLGVVVSVYRALGRFDRSVNFSNLLLLAQTAAMGAALLARFSPAIVVASMVLAVLIAWCVLWQDLRASYAGFRFTVARPTRKEISDVVANSGSFTVIQAAQAIILSGSVVLLGYLEPSTGAVVAFSVERTLAGVLRLTMQQVSLAFGAEMARQFMHGDREPLRFLYRSTGRLGAAVTGILGGLVLALAGPVIALWTHGSVVHDPALLLALTGAVILGAPASPAIVLFVLTNRPRHVARATFAQALMMVLLSVPLIVWLGPLGVALAWAVAELLTQGIYLARVAARTIDLPVIPYILATLAFAMAWLAGSFAVAFALAQALAPASILMIGLVVVGWAIVVAPAAVAFLLTADQRRWSAGKIRDRIPFAARR